MMYYTVAMLEEICRHEFPEGAEEVIKKRAKELHREMNTLDTSWKRSNRRFYNHVELIGEGCDWSREKQLAQYKK
jgi:hypothetical protein